MKRKGRYHPGEHFDFAVFDNAQTPSDYWLLEMDGLQHFEASNFGSKKKTARECFLINVQRDIGKDSLVKGLNIDLLRIPYTCPTPDLIKQCIVEFLEERHVYRRKLKSEGLRVCNEEHLYTARNELYDSLIVDSDK